MQILTPVLSERKRIHKNICKKHPQWKWHITIHAILMFMAVAIAGYSVQIVFRYSEVEGIYISLGVAICLGCVPFFTALSVKNTAKYKCAFPYSSYANGSLILNEDTLEYVFWRVGPREPAAYSSKHAVYRDEDKFVYRISKNDINSIVIKDDICKIKGNGTIHIPEWTDEIDEFVKRNNTEFSFIMAFEQKDVKQIIEEWWKQ